MAQCCQFYTFDSQILILKLLICNTGKLREFKECQANIGDLRKERVEC